MTIREMVGQGLHYARTCKSLWLFGFIVGAASGGSNGGGNGGGGTGGFDFDASRGAWPGSWPDFFTGPLAAFLIAILLAVLLLMILRLIAEGALIEGVFRARQGQPLTMWQALRAGVAHWGVLLRIALLYFAATCGSIALLVAPCVILMRTFGPRAALVYAIPAALVALPWLVTLFLVQAFAWRIAVLENRHALDAIIKARLFLHGRILHGLKLIVAMFVGTLGIVIIGLAALTPVALVLVALVPVLRILPVIIIGVIVLVPALSVMAAFLGTFRSSVWTIGYLTQMES